MTQQVINVPAIADQGYPLFDGVPERGDSWVTVLNKTNSNFSELYTAGPPSSQLFKLEDFGGSGNGVKNNGPAWIEACNAISNAGGGYICLAPGGTYFIDISALPDQTRFSSISGAKGTGVIGNGATLSMPYSGYSSSNYANYFLQFTGCRFIDISDVTVSLFVDPVNAGNVNTVALRGLNVWLFENGCADIAIHNIRQSGGMTCVWSVGSTITGLIERIVIYNVYLDTSHYGWHFVGTNKVKGANCYIQNQARALFIENSNELDLWCHGKDGIAQDVDVSVWNDPADTSRPGNICSNIKIHYKYTTSTTDAHALVALVLRTNTTGCVLRNIEIEYDIDGNGAIVNALAFFKQNLSQGDDTATPRGHIVENITVKGDIRNVGNGSWGPLFTSWSGETVSAFRFDDLVIRDGYTAINFDTSCLANHLAISDVVFPNASGDIFLQGTKAGQIHVKSYKSNNNGTLISDAFAKYVVSAGNWVRTGL